MQYLKPISHQAGIIMRALVQRVRSASVHIDSRLHSSIEEGLLVLLGVHSSDDEDRARWVAHKVANLRLFADADEKMNLSTIDTAREILVVSQFTLYGDCSKGFRPSFIESARPEHAQPLYQTFVQQLRSAYGLRVSTGVFGAMMDVSLVNWGPVTVMVEK